MPNQQFFSYIMTRTS